MPLAPLLALVVYLQVAPPPSTPGELPPPPAPAPAAPVPAPAPPREPTRPRDRAGFFLGFGLGAGVLVAPELRDQGYRSTSLVGGLFNFRLGGGLSERLLMMGEAVGHVTRRDDGRGVRLLTSMLLLSTQIYATRLDPQLYARVGVGFASAREEYTDTRIDVTDNRPGFAALGLVGYEWRLTEMFALSAELGTYLAVTDLATGVIPHAQAGFVWFW